MLPTDVKLLAQLAVSVQFDIFAELCHEHKILFIGAKHFFCGRNKKIPVILTAFYDVNPAVCFK